MSRFLFVMPPLASHILPAVSVARALAGLGHEVAWVGSESYLRPLTGPDAVVFATGLRPYRGQRDRGLRAVRSLWEGFLVPSTRATFPAVDKATADYRPDVVVVDQHAPAGALAAYRHDRPWVSLAATMMELTRPYAQLSTVDAWMRAHLAAMWRGAGLPGEPVDDLRFSPHLLVAFTCPILTAEHQFPDHYVLVGSALAERAEVPEFPWSALDSGRRLVLVTTGTLVADLSRDFYQRMARALRPLAGTVQAVFNTDSVVADPADIVQAPRVPVLELMPRLDGVVGHGGMGTTGETLTYGRPLVVAPIRYDQPIVARQVVAAGAGVRVRFGRATPDQLRAAVGAILDEPTYQAGAQRVAASVAAAGGAPVAARHLARIAAG